jgi:hypothetical protein
MIELEPFSESKFHSVSQAHDLKQLVEQERGWLMAVQPGTVERYQSRLKGARNIMRIAGHRHDPEVPAEANIIRRDRAAIGIATIIRNQQIVHPDEGLFTGNDVDYWLRLGERGTTHTAAAQAVLAQAGQAAIATVIEGHPNPAIGFSRIERMRQVGVPAQLSTGDRKDVFDIARQGLVSQLYVAGWGWPEDLTS